MPVLIDNNDRMCFVLMKDAAYVGCLGFQKKFLAAPHHPVRHSELEAPSPCGILCTLFLYIIVNEQS